MTRTLLLLGILALTGCGPSQLLMPGTWTGTIAPQRHPDMATPISYEVAYPDGMLALALVDLDGNELPARDARLDGDTLRFAFDEPEGNVPLTCALGREDAGFSGRCTDPSGQWARFTMAPPSD